MAKFTIYSPSGTALYTGAPTFTGQYMKPGLLEFREVALPALVELVPGCYVDYTRTGRRYRIYTVPQLKKQARSLSYGGAFVYQSVQLYDASKMLEYCPFRDLVLGDNRIHFSTQPSISTFEGCDGLARRFEACLVDQYGEGSWRVRIATAEENPSLHDLMLEPRDFTVSGVNILECLDKIYEIWPEVGWIYKVELVDGVPTDTIIIGGGGINSNTGSYAYGKGNGLTSLTRTAANAEEIANRIFAYGSSRNMVLPSWYRNQDIKDAESVDIENIMLPILPIVSKDWAGWGLTDGERDAAKAFVENAASILKNGLRPATVYFDGKGEYPEIYPSIRETTIGMVRNALGDSTAKYYPSTEIYTDSGARVDKLLSAQAAFDSGLAGADGKSSTDVGYIAYEHSAATPIAIPAGSVHTEAFASGTIAVSGSGRLNIELSYPGIGLLTGCGSVYLDFSFVKVHGGTTTTIYTQRVVMNPSDAGGHSVPEGKITYAGNTLFESGDSLAVAVNLVFNNQSGATDTSAFLTNASGTMTVKTSNHRDKTFTISLRQLGFDINEQADLGNGKTIAMRTGDCAGRSFSIKSVQYNSANDCWDLECWRSEDESLSQWFPNSQFGVAVGDEFVLLDIAMPDIYIAMASEKLLDAARDLLEESAVERWQYNPEIDAKFMVENSRTINAGEYLILSDADIIGPSAESILVDAITINEGEAAIPTYKVTLRDRKKKTWTESQSPEQSSSKSVGSITESNTQQSSNGGGSYFQLDEDGNVTLKPQYQNLWVPGWLASGGIGQGGSGGGGLIDGVYTANYLGTIYSPTGTDDITKTFSAFAIDKIWQAVLDLQQSTPNVSLVNGANNSTLTVNGVIADFYTKSQVDAIVGAVYRPAGNASSVSALGALTAANIGKVYNMTAAFTTTADFLEGAGKSFPAGTNVVIVDAGSGTYKYDVLSGFVDLSGYAQKVSGATNGNFAGLDSTGNLTDSGHKHGDYVTALGTNGNYLTWTKNGQTNNITVPFATTATKIGTATVGSTAKPVYINAGVPTLLGTVGTSTMPVYLNNGTITQISSFPESYLSWGGKNFSASYGPIDAAMVDVLGACRTMFLKKEGIVIEYSTDGGVTWADYGATDAQKVSLFSTGGTYFYTGKNTTTGAGSVNNMLRVTMLTSAGGVYTSLNKFVILVSTNGSSGCYCTIRCRTQQNYEDNVDTWVTRADQVPINGWTGYNVINITATTTYGNTKASQYGEWQFIFGYTGYSGSSTGLAVPLIRGFGGVGWTVPSNMAKNGHLYAYDSLQNATFPAAIYANVNGSDLGSSSKRWKVYGTSGDFSSMLTVGDHIKRTFTASNQNAVLTIAAGNYDNYIWALSELAGTTNDLRYGFGLKYIGLGSGNANYLRLMVGNTSGTPLTSLTIDQIGRIAIGADATDTNYRVTVAGALGVSDAITLSGSTASARRIYFGDANHYLELDEHGFHFSHGVYSDDFVSAGGIGNGGGSGSATELGDLVDVALTSRSNGDLLVYNSATSHWENKPQSSIIPTVSVSFNDLTSHPTTIAGYGITDANIDNGVITLGGSTITPLTTETDPTVPSWAKASSKPSYSLSEISGTDDLRAIEALAGTAGLLKKTAANTWSLDTNPYVYEVNTQGDGFLDFVHNNGDTTRIDLNHEHSNYVPITRTINGSPLSQDITITAQGLGVASWAMGSGSGSTIPFNVLPGLFVARTQVASSAANGTLLGIDAISNSASSGNSDTSRFAWDSVNGAWHFLGNLYVDGWLAAGGIGANGGGGGYGVESITSNQDGTVDFHFTGGDITTVDLNHTHDGLLPDVDSSNNGKIMKVVNGEWALADESGGGGGGSGYEVTSNKVTSVSSSSTDTQYPSAKCVYDIVGDVETLLAAL